MRKMPILTTLATLALISGNAVQADDTSSSLFQNLDADANGYISEQEAAANPDLHARWQELDADKNNQLDVSEFSAFEIGIGTGVTTDQGGALEREQQPASDTPKY
ncbi:MAG: hypothetical protein ABR553_02620 [Gammaproteobacteria bacterium]